MSAESARLRALLVTTDFPPTHGGIQTMAAEIVRRARRTSFRVVAPADPGDADVGARVRRVRAIAPGRRGYVPTLAIAAARECRRARPAVALAMHVLAAPGPLLAGVPTVVAVHGGELRSARIARIARRVLPRAARVVANSRYTLERALEAGADPARARVVPVGAPPAFEASVPGADDLRERLGGGRIVLSVGRLAPHKGHTEMVRVVKELPADVRLVVVGEGSARGEIEAAARDAGVSDRVVLAGAVPDGELAAYYGAADAFALLPRETTGRRAGVEGGGIALLEAAAAGLPVVATAVGGIPETIRDGETGLLVHPGDARGAAEALRRVLEDRALGAKLGAQAKALAQGERSWTAIVEEWERVLEEAAAG